MDLETGYGLIKENKLTTPANDNAKMYFDRVLKIDPDNESAKHGLKLITDKYSQFAMNAENDELAMKYVKRGLSVDSEDQFLLLVEQELKSKAKRKKENEEFVNKLEEKKERSRSDLRRSYFEHQENLDEEFKKASKVSEIDFVGYWFNVSEYYIVNTVIKVSEKVQTLTVFPDFTVTASSNLIKGVENCPINLQNATVEVICDGDSAPQFHLILV